MRRALPLSRLAACALFAAALSPSGFAQPAPPVALPAPAAVLRLWPQGKTPGVTTPLPEKGSAATGFTNVSDPTITLYPANRTTPAPAILICPGGGYGHLAYAKEGIEIAQWLNTLGITGVVLKYRVPDNRAGAAQDIERAMHLTRAHAAEWKIDPDKLGVMGFSAGGHLCAWLCTNFEKEPYLAVDATDKESCRPDFAVLVYPAYLNKGAAVAPELPVSAKVPPTLLIHNEDDAGFLRGTRAYHAALEQAKVPNSFLLYKTGGHGYGLRSTPDKGVHVWPKDCQAWLAKMKLCSPPAR